MPQMNFCPQCASPLIPGTASGRERLTCSKPCGYIFYDNPLPVVGGIAECDDETVMLTQCAHCQTQALTIRNWPGSERMAGKSAESAFIVLGSPEN